MYYFAPMNLELSTDIKRRWSSRKFWAMVYFQMLWVLMFWCGPLTGDSFENLTFLTVGGYFAANVGQQLLLKTKGE